MAKNRMSKFYKVSFNQFLADYSKVLDLDKDNTEVIIKAREIWNNIQLPLRKTKGSAGYDFNSTLRFTLEPNQTVLIPTGIKCDMKEDWVMLIFPRSSMGIKKKMFITNTIPVIDSDYFNNTDNEGHIFISITNNGNEIICLNEGDSFAQAIFFTYGTTLEDDTNETRVGGIGSTSGK